VNTLQAPPPPVLKSSKGLDPLLSNSKSAAASEDIKEAVLRGFRRHCWLVRRVTVQLREVKINLWL